MRIGSLLSTASMGGGYGDPAVVPPLPPFRDLRLGRLGFRLDRQGGIAATVRALPIGKGVCADSDEHSLGLVDSDGHRLG